MGMFDELQKELDRAGTVAKAALDEGKLRLDLFRARRLADEAAEALGYAVHRARRDGRELDAETLQRLDATLATHASEVERIEAELRTVRAACASAGATAGAADENAAPSASGAASPPS